MGGLIYQGPQYIRNRGIKRQRDDKEVIYWRCQDRSCPGKMTTIGVKLWKSRHSSTFGGGGDLIGSMNEPIKMSEPIKMF